MKNSYCFFMHHLAEMSIIPAMEDLLLDFNYKKCFKKVQKRRGDFLDMRNIS